MSLKPTSKPAIETGVATEPPAQPGVATEPTKAKKGKTKVKIASIKLREELLN